MKQKLVKPSIPKWKMFYQSVYNLIDVKHS